jgi:hypothetical protein
MKVFQVNQLAAMQQVPNRSKAKTSSILFKMITRWRKALEYRNSITENCLKRLNESIFVKLIKLHEISQQVGQLHNYQ